jgi:DNA-3-methyladenine glycosylase
MDVETGERWRPIVAGRHEAQGNNPKTPPPTLRHWDAPLLIWRRMRRPDHFHCVFFRRQTLIVGQILVRRIRPLSRSELPVDTGELACFLVGKTLVHDSANGRMSGRIVETEAYVVGDAAAHSFRGRTPRNGSLFKERGYAYVYFIYGMWYCLNVSGDAEGVGAGVLLRAVEAIDGIDLMEARRPSAKLCRLASGPGSLATAFGIDRRFDGMDLCGGCALWLGASLKGRCKVALGNSVRIGLTKEADRLLRFYERGNSSVSGPARLRS